MNTNMKYEQTITIPWYRTSYRKNFSYYDEDLKLWFVIYYDDKIRKEFQGAGQTRERAYNRLAAANCIPGIEKFPVLVNLEKSYKTTINLR